MRKIYLFRLYRYDKKLFFFIAIFAGLTVFCNLSQKETTPFFVWGMYSENIKPLKNYDVLKITINDGVLVDPYALYSDNTRAFLNAPLAYYRQIKQNRIDPVIPFLKTKLKTNYARVRPFERQLFNTYSQQDFMNWYHCYLEKITGVSIHTIRIDILRTQFNKEQHLFVDSSYLFETWAQH